VTRIRLYPSIPAIFLLIAAVAATTSCDRAITSAAPLPASQSPAGEAVPHSREANDAGRFLAGLPSEDGSAFSEFENTDAWKLHRKELDRAWANMEAATIPEMREFQKKELSTPAIEKSTVFYPFSGPDSLVLSVFFPKNPTYVMVGLEPPGTLPTPKQLEKKDLSATLGAVRETVYDELHRSFFITRQMDKHFRGQVTDGLFSPILQLMVRTNHTVLGYRYVRLDDDGQIVERKPDYVSPTGTTYKGVEIEFKTGDSPTVQRLYYFSFNLADQRLSQNKPFAAFMAKQKGMTTYFKATSYMTHRKEFSIIREQVVNASAAILQDDSGIPYKYISDSPWSVKLFGEFDHPYGSFRWYEQKDLKQAYNEKNPTPLKFKIGYGFSKVPSNLLLATRPH